MRPITAKTQADADRLAWMQESAKRAEKWLGLKCKFGRDGLVIYYPSTTRRRKCKAAKLQTA